MIRFSFSRGLRFFEGHRIWTIVRRLADGRLQLEDNKAEIKNQEEKEILRQYMKGEYVVDEESLHSDGSSCHIVVPRDLSTYPKEEQKQAIRRQEYLMKLKKEDALEGNIHELCIKIKKVAAELGDLYPPSPSSIYRWNRRYGSGNSVTALVARNENKGRRSNWPSEAKDIIDMAIEEIYLKNQKHPKKAVVEKVQLMVAERNRLPTMLEKIKAPSKSSIYRYLDRLYQYEVDAARAGKSLLNTKYRVVLGSVKVSRIHERWEIDHTPIDLLVYCEKSHLPMGKPWMTAILDRYSRVIVGFYISFQAPSADSVLQAIVHAILPKEEFLENYPDIKTSWPVSGIGEEIVADNGMDLHSDSFRYTCYELNIGMIFCAAKTPQQKGAIERFFRTLNHGVIHRLPGTVFANTEQRGDYPSENLAAIGFQTLTHLITKWIVEDYHQTPHRSLKDTPINVWNKGYAERVIEYPASPEQLKIITGKTKTPTLFHYGVELFGLNYNNVELQEIRRHLGESEKIKLTIKFYESDVGYIHVFNPVEKVYFRVNAIKMEYANGLHRAQHRLIQKVARERQIDASNINRLLEVKEEMRLLIEGAIYSKKMKHRKKSAQMREVNSNKPSGDREASEKKPQNLIGNTPEEWDEGLDEDIPSFDVIRKTFIQIEEE